MTAIAVAPGGAWPASCLPFYVTDYAALADAFARPDGRLAEALAVPNGTVPFFVRRAAQIGAAALAKRPEVRRDDRPASIDEIMAVRIAAELGNDSLCQRRRGVAAGQCRVPPGQGDPRAGHDLATMSCGHLDVAPSPLILSLIETLDGETAAAHAGGDDTYSTYYQAGAVTHEIVAAAQVDRRGRVNTIALRKRDGATIRLPGQGGMADVANMHRDYVLYVTRHSPQSVVEAVETASSARGLLTKAERSAAGYRTGRALVFTDLCVFRLDQATRQLVVAETMPGVIAKRRSARRPDLPSPSTPTAARSRCRPGRA